MKIFIISCLLAVAAASPQWLSVAPHVASQYHAQDELGQYSYGYSGGPSAKQETRTADGITRGSYSYIDAHGLVQSASYVSDPINGFRVAATNIPQAPAAAVVAPAVAAAPVLAAPAIVSHTPVVAHPGGAVAPLETPEVIAAKAQHFAAHGEALARLGRKKRAIAYTVPAVVPARSFAYSTVAAHHPYVAAAPLAYSAIAPAGIPAVAPAVVPAAVKSQYHSQDELGQYSYGYTDGLSAKHEVKTADGITQGGYSYVDSNGIVQSVKYVADGLGFRVAATNLPVGPVA